jgi:hypothetical protein
LRHHRRGAVRSGARFLQSAPLMPSLLRFVSFAAVSLAPALAFAEEPPPPAAPATTVTIVLPPPVAPAALTVAPVVWLPASPPDTVVMHQRSKGLMIGGFFVTGAGAAGVGGGVHLISSIHSKPSRCADPTSDGTIGGTTGSIVASSLCGVGEGFNRAIGLGVGWTLVIGGSLWTVGGVAMSFLGGQQVPVKPKKTKVPVALTTPSVSVGIGSVSASWSF